MKWANPARQLMERHRRARGGYAVVAYGMCNGLGNTTEEVIASLAAGRSGLARPPLELPFETVCGAVADPMPPLPPPLAHTDTRIVRMAALGLRDLHAALTRATERWGASRVGAAIGTSTGGLAQTEAAFAEQTRNRAMPAWFDFERQHPFHLVVDAACALTGIEGPRCAVSTACSSSAKVFGVAARWMEAGVCDAVLVGGVDTLCQTTLRGFHSLGVLSAEPCRPFGQERRGISIGEGAAFLLLERDSDGPARFLGIGESSDAFHMSAPDPAGHGARIAMEAALADASLSPSDVGYVNAHGTGTLKSDAAEARAIADVFGDSAWVASTKGYTGHLLGAGGATEAAFSVAALERGFVPASLGAAPLDADLAAIRVAATRVDVRLRAVISNSFAFGGSNACVAFGAPG
jgi:3-oxoacyl-[acyl-carrier-protein] synthase-1